MDTRCYLLLSGVIRSRPSNVSNSSRNISLFADISAKTSQGSQLGPLSLRARFDGPEVGTADDEGAGLGTPTEGVDRPMGLGGPKPASKTGPAEDHDEMISDFNA